MTEITLQNIIIRHEKSIKGQALVEFAVVLMLFISFIFGMIEFGRVMMVQHVLDNAARAAVRDASLGVPKVTATVNSTYITPQLISANIPTNQTTITWTPTDISTATEDTAVTVLISVPFSKVTLSGIVKLFGIYDLSGVTLRGRCTMRKEKIT